MDYPTREQAEMMATLNDEVTPTSYCGKRFLAMHDAIDGKDTALDWCGDAIDDLALENGLLKIEIAKAKHLINRMVVVLEFVDAEMYTEDLLIEAEAMTKGEYESF